jgi:dihydrofolate reductase
VDLSLSLPFATDVSMDVLGRALVTSRSCWAEPIGPKVIVHFRLDVRSVVGRPAVLEARTEEDEELPDLAGAGTHLVASLSSRATAETGHTIPLAIDPDRLHFFDPTTSWQSKSSAMAKLIYSTIASLDGYIEDENGNFDWAAPDEEVHSFVNDLERPVGTYLYGRRMYDTMAYWETADTVAGQPPVAQDYAEIWQAADKVVYSSTLETVSSARTRIEREFDSEAVRQLKAGAGRDLTVGGPDLAAQAIKAGLVDELHLFLAPIVVGGGKRALPDGVRVKLELLDERRFGSSFVHLHYAVL